jgi:hypothetical protein
MWIERAKVVADLERRSDEGTKAAKKRWNDVKNNCAAKPNGLPMPDPMQDQTRADQSRAESTFPQTAFADTHASLSKDPKNSKPTEAQTEQLYGLYPRKRGKIDAKKAIRTAVALVMAGDPVHPAMPLDDALDYLAQRVTLYARTVQGSDFIPYPATWFNGGGYWDDERDWSKNRNGSNSGKQSVTPGSALDYHRELLESSAT